MMTPQKYYLSNKNGFKINSNNTNKTTNNTNSFNNKPNHNNNSQKSISSFNNDSNKNTFKTDDISKTIKEIIIKYIYNKIDLKEYKFVQINNSVDILDLKNSKYYISANYGGIPSLLVFLKYNDEYYSYLIDRRSLSFKGINNEGNTNYMINTVRMTKIKLSVDIKFYDGTILDCCLIDNIYNEQLQIIINDIFYLCGKSLLTINYKKKIFTCKSFIENNYKNEKNDNARLHISPTYELNSVVELFKEYIGVNLTNLNIKGVVFYPKTSSTKLIYIFDRSDNQYREDIINNKIIIGVENNLKSDKEEENKNDEDVEKIIKFELTDIGNMEDIVLNFEMKKTKKSDVYKLYSIFYIGNKFYKKKISIAYIPSYVYTLKCKNFFEKNDSVIVECLFHSYKGLWIPQKISSLQKIDIINKDSRLKITEMVVKNNTYDDNFN
jgi:hypothetical protein